MRGLQVLSSALLIRHQVRTIGSCALAVRPLEIGYKKYTCILANSLLNHEKIAMNNSAGGRGNGEVSAGGRLRSCTAIMFVTGTTKSSHFVTLTGLRGRGTLRRGRTAKYIQMIERIRRCPAGLLRSALAYVLLLGALMAQSRSSTSSESFGHEPAGLGFPSRFTLGYVGSYSLYSVPIFRALNLEDLAWCLQQVPLDLGLRLVQRKVSLPVSLGGRCYAD